MLSQDHWTEAKRLYHDALALDTGDRDAFLRAACGDDTRLFTEVCSLLAWNADADGFLDTPVARLGGLADPSRPASVRVGDRLGTWRVVDLIGHGGMGAVYRAERADEAFERPAAIKVVRGGRESARIVEWFRHERQTLAALDHPNIARLIDGGSTPEGEPYFVMEYVDGTRVDRYCDEQRLRVAARIDVFLAVCSGVRYAHQNLVVHCDIKPDNILVSREGVPKLLDFGVAKIVSSGAEAAGDEHRAATTVWVLTPDYASPEQVAGQDRVTTATDVYSLGVLLYVLLTGQRPYHLSASNPADLGAELAATPLVPPSVRVTAPTARAAVAAVARRTSPQKLAACLSGDLDAIVLMALSRDASERYASVDALVQDIDRYRRRFPVTARVPTLAYVSGRFIRRHRMSLAVAAAVVLLILVGSGLVLWQARVAADARALAERRFDEVRALARAFMFDVHDAIVNVPGTTAARGLLVGTGVEYLDRLAAEAGGDAGLQRELASAYVKVGDAQGHPTSPNLGDTAGARTSYERAIGIASALVTRDAADRDAARTLALAHRRLGDVLAWAGDLDGALAETQRSRTLFADIAGRPSPTVQDRLQAGIAEVKLGDVLGSPALPNLGRHDEAMARFERALEVLRGLDADVPGERGVRRFLGLTLERIGQLHESAQRWAAATAAYEESFRIRAQLAQSVPSHTDIERDLAIAYEKLGNVQRLTGDLPAALASYRGALARFERLLQADSSNVSALRTVAISQEKVAQVLAMSNGRSEAVVLLTQALDTHGTIASRDADNVQARCDQARVGEQLGDVGRAAAACRAWAASLEVHRALEDAGRSACGAPAGRERLLEKLSGCQ